MAAVLLFLACASGLPRISLNLSGVEFSIEVANTPEARQRGLMGRTSLGQNEGMLFVFERDERVAFWMKDTVIPLSVAYIDSRGVIREIYDLTPGSLRPVESNYAVRYALEVLQGTFERLGIGPGYRLDLPAGLR